MAAHTHRTHHTGWMRAGLLGANDGVLSISGLMLGVAASHATASGIVAAGVAGLVAGALSMGAGEYVSVSSQADTERSDLDMERKSLADDFEAEQAELSEIYVRRGLDPELAKQVARQLMAHDALSAHARDDIGLTDALSARPLQAAFASTVSFMAGGLVPLVTGVLVPAAANVAIAVVSFATLAGIGAFTAHVGGSSRVRGALRVLAWGVAAMGITYAAGALFGAVV